MLILAFLPSSSMKTRDVAADTLGVFGSCFLFPVSYSLHTLYRTKNEMYDMYKYDV